MRRVLLPTAAKRALLDVISSLEKGRGTGEAWRLKYGHMHRPVQRGVRQAGLEAPSV